MRYFALFLLSLSSGASASYRVHVLKLTHYNGAGKPIKQEKVLSTLDHLQYEHWHSGYRVMKAELVDTWYCPGDTSGHRELCPKPESATPTRGPASTDPKRLPYGRQPVIP
jgi:hypothetical protein